jgi:AraC-like DNA-binding protein
MAVSTDTVDAGDRLDFWTSAVSQTYVDLECTVPGRDRTISGRIDSTELGMLGLSRVTSSAQSVLRTPAGISRTSDDYFLVSVQVAGTGMVVQDQRTAVLGPGDFAVYDSTRPYELLFDDRFIQYVLMLPGATLRTLVSDTNTLTARQVNGRAGAGRLLITMIESIMDDVEMGVASAEAVAQSVEYILVAGLVELSGSRTDTPYSAQERLDQIKRTMILRLRDPGLSVSSLAAQLHLSVSSIHRAFAVEPSTPSEWIWARRLDAVRRELIDPANAHITIGQLAHDWGFTDPAHFSRAFRARFGCSPRQYRTRG